MDIISAYQKRQKDYDVAVVQSNMIKQTLNEKEIAQQQRKDELTIMEGSRTILQKTSDEAREKAKDLLESTVTTALQHVFGSNFEAIINTDISNGKPVADILVQTDYGNGNIVAKAPEDARGGGIVDIVSIALRIAMTELHQEPKINGSIILDEPGKHVSADYAIKLAEFLKYVSNQFNKQIIFVTHSQDLKSIADTCYLAELKDGVTRMKKIDPKTGVEINV